MKTPETLFTPEQLAQAHRYLIAAFSFYMPLAVAVFILDRLEQAWWEQGKFILFPALLPLLSIAATVGSILLLIALYIAARRMGFSIIMSIAAIILSFFIDILFVILVVSADLRISKQLKAKGWKVGLLGAKPA